MDEDLVLVWTALPEESLALSIAETLVNEQLVACVHLLPQGRSFYRWLGRIHQEPEWTLLIKTRRSLYALLEARLLTLHPYDVPEILMTPIEQSSPTYAAWLLSVTQDPPTP